jgi:signal transduction histidine kinase
MTGIVTSLRGRFLLAILLWVALGIGAIWYSSVRLFTSHVEAQYHEELEVHVRELGGLTVLDQLGRPQMTRPLSDPRYGEPLSGFYWQITRPGYGTLKSPSMTRGGLDYDIAHSPSILHRVADGPTGHTIVYGFVREAPGGAPIHFVIATDERHLLRIISAFTRELTIWLMLLALALLASGLAIVTFGFQPFSRLAAAIDNLRQGSADRIAGRYPDELQSLVTDLNAYVARNSEIVERGRVQASALAHSLRTPLAVIIDEAECMQEGSRPDAAHTLLDQSERMQRQIDYHLARARSGGSTAGLATSSRLDPVLAPLITAMQRCYPGKAFGLPADLARMPAVPIDPDDLGEILSNLLDNAAKWARASITVAVRRNASGLEIAIDDDGPGIPAADREAMFAVGRMGSSGPVGTGLGLAIARDLARDYGGDVTLEQNATGGCRAILHLPGASGSVA